MNEEEAVIRMRYLQKSLETTYRYSNTRSALPEAFIIMLAAVLGANIISLISNVYNFVLVYPYLGNFFLSNGISLGIGVPISILFLAAGSFIYGLLYRSFTIPQEIQWEKYLSQGVVGIMQILETTDWEDILHNLRMAKQAFMVLSGLKLLLELGIIFIVVYLAYGIAFTIPFGIPPNPYASLAVSLLLLIGLGDKTVRKSYTELWRIDNLVAELRWFYIDFQRSEI